MGDVVRAGATIHAPTAGEYRDQLRSWSREARDAGDLDEVWADAEIEAEVASRADAFDLSVSLFAQLSDGRRVSTGEVAGMTLSSAYSTEGPPPPFAQLTTELVQSEALWFWRLPETGVEARWHALVEVLAGVDVKVTAAELEATPFDVEITDTLHRRIAELRAIPPAE